MKVVIGSDEEKSMKNNVGAYDPSWWTDSHSSSWERVKAALRRDWEQTKVDLGAIGPDRHQTIGDTVRQVLGRESPWDDVEPAIRYGHGARQQFTEKPEWDEELELQLRREWEEMAPGRLWSDVRQFVHRGWMGP